MAVYPLTELPKAYKIPAMQVDGTDAGAVHDALRESIDAIRSGGGPRFIETQTVRWPGSATNWPVVEAPTAVELAWDVSGVPEGVRDWYRDSDPVLRFMRELVESGNADRDELTTLNQSVVDQIAAAVDFGFDSPYPELAEAETDVFADPRSPVR
jgi:pyruvate dehydrogenase E1 component alpha subunit